MGGLSRAALSMAPGSVFAHITEADDTFIEVVWVCPCKRYQLHVEDDDTMIEKGFATGDEVHAACEEALEEHMKECPDLLEAYISTC